MEYNNVLPHNPAMGPYPYPYHYSTQFVPPAAVADQDPTVNEQMTQQLQAAAARDIMNNRVRMVTEQQGMCSEDVAANSNHKEEIEIWMDPNVGENHQNNGMETMMPNTSFVSQTSVGRISGFREKSAFSSSSTSFGSQYVNAIPPPTRIGSTRRGSVASANTDTKSVISTAGSIDHRCHGHSKREVSIIELFSGLDTYQSRQYREKVGIDFLLAHSQKSIRGENGGPLDVNQTEMWFMALEYLLNDASLGQFESMSDEMRFVVKRLLSEHKKRSAFFKSIREFGFSFVLNNIRRKMPEKNVRKQMEWERRKSDEKIKNMIKRQERAAAPTTAPPPGFCSAPPMASAMDLAYKPRRIPLEISTAVPVQSPMTPLAPNRPKRYAEFPPARPPRHQRRGRSLIGQRSVSVPDLTPFAASGLNVGQAPPAATHSDDDLNYDEIDDILSEIDREIAPGLLPETRSIMNMSRGSGMTGALHRADAPAYGSLRNTRSISAQADTFMF